MPAVSEAQRNFMRLCLHSPGKAHKPCPSKKVAKEFSHMQKEGRKKPKKG